MEPNPRPLPDHYAPVETVPVALRSILAVTHDRHMDMVNLVHDLPDEALNWRPGPRMNALAGLVWDIMDIEQRVLGAVTGDPAAVPGENGALLNRTGTEGDRPPLLPLRMWQARDRQEGPLRARARCLT